MPPHWVPTARPRVPHPRPTTPGCKRVKHAPILVATLCLGLAHSLAARADDAGLRARLEQARDAHAQAAPEGAFESIAYMLDVADRHPGSAASWRREAARYIEALEKGRNPFPEQDGAIVNRGYISDVSERRQGYALYLPPGYDPSRRYPLMITLHGGSANGNLFLGVVLGNNMDWKKYRQHLWDRFEPRWKPDWIVVAPDGFGQVMWRWMGEQDVLDVLDDVRKHYSVDADRVALMGLSNGAVGAYAMGLRHAWRFSTVMAIAGAPSWLQYAGGHMRDPMRRAIKPMSGMHLAENAINTDFRYYHGTQDPGPMRPRYVKEFEAHIQDLDVTLDGTWFDEGHDLLYRVMRHARVFEPLAEQERDPHPREVRIVTGDYRANRQHWLTVTRIREYPRLARVRALADDDTLRIEPEGADALAVDLRDAPLKGDPVRIVVDGVEVYDGARRALGHVLHLKRTPIAAATGTEADAQDAGAADASWQLGFPDPPSPPVKRPGRSGPITDAYFGRMVHVYGTAVEDQREALRKAARKGAQGWPLWLWGFEQKVVADSEVTDAMMRRAHLVLYGTARNNALLKRMEGLPMHVTDGALHLGGQQFPGNDVGARYIYPNPLVPDRYVIVQTGVTSEAVYAGHRLPDFLPDYVVYDRRTTRGRPRLTFGGRRPLALGYFDDRWRLPSNALSDM